jgi:hypothetical protein
MIGSFIAHGLSMQECADESLIQMYYPPLSLSFLNLA